MVFARKYRPKQFDEVVGQEHVSTTLANSITSKRISHAYLFCGPRGIGKTSMARIFAKALNCEKCPTTTPCDRCESCIRIQEGSDVDVVELDAASNRNVEDIRALRESSMLAPMRSRYKILIIDEAHMLTRESFNTLLKILEEPPPHLKFIFATTEAEKIPETIQSRCQRFDFVRIGTAAIVKRLKQIAAAEKIKISEETLNAIARRAKGGLRDAESLLDQVTAYKPNPSVEDVLAVTGAASSDRMLQYLASLSRKEIPESLKSLNDIINSGIDPTVFVEQAIEFTHSILLVKTCGEKTNLLDASEEERKSLIDLAKDVSVETALYWFQIFVACRRALHEGLPPTVILNVFTVKCIRGADLQSLPEILSAIRAGGSSQGEKAASDGGVRPTPIAPKTATEPAVPTDFKTVEKICAAWSKFVEWASTELALSAQDSGLLRKSTAAAESDALIYVTPPDYGSTGVANSLRRINEHLKKCSIHITLQMLPRGTKAGPATSKSREGNKRIIDILGGGEVISEEEK